MKSCKIQLPDYQFFYFLFQLLNQQIIVFTNFQNFIQHYLKKYFHRKISYFNEFTQTTPTPAPKSV